MMTMIRPESLSGPSAVSLFDRAGDRGTVELHGEPVSEADWEQFEVIADVHEPDENAQDRSRSHLCGIGWIPGLRAVAAGAGAYLLCVPWRERTITTARSTFVGRPAGTLYLGRVGHVSRQAAHHRTDERNDKWAKR